VDKEGHMMGEHFECAAWSDSKSFWL